MKYTALFTLFCITITLQATNWGEQFSRDIMTQYPTSILQMNNSKGWEYSNSIVLHGMQRVYHRTEDATIRSQFVPYAQRYIDTYLNADGSLKQGILGQNLDKIHPGVICLFLYEQTGIERYKRAAEGIRAFVETLPKNPLGGFYHKNTTEYKDVMLLDGIYMAEPFLAKYGFLFGDQAALNTALDQLLLIFGQNFDKDSHLLYHGWDYSKTQSWSKVKPNGVSPWVWSRAMGWYVMALVDILEYTPTSHPRYGEIVGLLHQVAVGIKGSQQPNGLWLQIMNPAPTTTGNFTETSGSAMFLYALQKGIDFGWLSINDYASTISKGWSALETEYIETLTDSGRKRPRINSFCAALGCREFDTQYTASTLKVNCPTSSHPHGYCGILLAASTMEYQAVSYRAIEFTTPINGSIEYQPNLPQAIYYPVGTEIEVIAKPEQGYQFKGWYCDGELVSSQATIKIEVGSQNRLFTPVFELGPPSSTISSTILYQGGHFVG